MFFFPIFILFCTSDQETKDIQKAEHIFNSFPLEIPKQNFLMTNEKKVVDDKIKLLISVPSHGEHTLFFKTFNVQAGIEKKQVSLSNGSPEELEIELSIADFNNRTSLSLFMIRILSCARKL